MQDFVSRAFSFLSALFVFIVYDGLSVPSLFRKGYFMIKVMQCYYVDLTAATAIEYGLIVAGISVAIVAVVFAFGGDLGVMFTDLQTALASNSP